jgi:cytoskeleton protein RodZ
MNRAASMTEPQAAAGAGAQAGALLRAARERQGLHVAALAAAIKIPQRKLEALEAGRFEELPDATFTRALAMTVCRALKIDAAPVLAQLPQLGSDGLAAATGGLNAPFRDRPGRAEPASSFSPLRHPLSWAALAVLVAAAVVFLLPAGWWEGFMPGSMSLPAAPASAVQPAASPGASTQLPASAAAYIPAAAPVLAASAASAPMVEVVHSVPGADTSASAVADAAAGLAVLRATDATWVEVVDAGGQVLVQRQLQPGESLGLNGTLPFKLKIGNAAATQLQFRGQGVDLAPVTRDNVARLELK